MFKVNVEIGGGLVIAYHGLDGEGEVYKHPYYQDDYVWSCEAHEINAIFSQCNDEDNLYPSDSEVLQALESSGILSDLGLTYCMEEAS